MTKTAVVGFRHGGYRASDSVSFTLIFLNTPILSCFLDFHSVSGRWRKKRYSADVMVVGRVGGWGMGGKAIPQSYYVKGKNILSCVRRNDEFLYYAPSSSSELAEASPSTSLLLR